MADLLTHVLVPFVAVTVASWKFPIDHRWRPVAMGGAVIPDLVKFRLLVDSDVIGRAIGTQFTYGPVSSISGVVVVAAFVALLFEKSVRRRCFGWLAFGGTTALVLDGMRMYADGRAGFWLYPLPWRPPTPGLYVTSDPTVAAVAVLTSVAVVVVDVTVFGDSRFPWSGVPDSE